MILSPVGKCEERKTPMKITSTGITDGRFDDRFGKRGDCFDAFGRPSRSFPFDIREASADTVSFAFILEDKDAIPVCGCPWIHWTGANLKSPGLEEDASRHELDIVQGTTSWSAKIGGGRDRLAVSSYGGMTPPDRPHTYELHVYALDCVLPLEPGFYANELYWAMQGHIMDQATLRGTY